MQIPFVASAYSRSQGVPEARLVNLYPEKTPVAMIPDARFPRPGLASAYTLGSGPIRGMFRKAGFQGGALFVVSGTTLYTSDGTTIGTIPGTDYVRFDASPTQLVAVSSGIAYLWDGTTFGTITDIDLPAVSDVVYMAGRHVYSQQGSGRFYWSEIADAGNIDGLSFSNAESSPDNDICLAVLGDQMAIFGSESTEFWSATTDGDNPFQVNEGTRYQKGCIAQQSVALLDNALFFVGNDLVVYRTGNVAQRVSDHGIENKLRQCASLSTCTAFAALVEGHAWYVLNIPGVGSFGYDVATQLWSEWQSYGRTTFRGCLSANINGVAYIGDDTTSTIWTLNVGTFQDGSDPITRVATAFYKTDQPSERCNNVILQCVKGVGLATGQGSDPIVEMRYSDTEGKTWVDWRQGTLGKVGEYGKRAYWTKLGLVRRPGRIFEFRTTDPVNTVFESVWVNESRV